MKSNKKLFGRFYRIVSSEEGAHALIWTKKKVGKRWKIMYVERIHKNFEEFLYGERKEEIK